MRECQLTGRESTSSGGDETSREGAAHASHLFIVDGAAHVLVERDKERALLLLREPKPVDPAALRKLIPIERLRVVTVDDLEVATEAADALGAAFAQ